MDGHVKLRSGFDKASRTYCFVLYVEVAGVIGKSCLKLWLVHQNHHVFHGKGRRIVLVSTSFIRALASLHTVLAEPVANTVRNTVY